MVRNLHRVALAALYLAGLGAVTYLAYRGFDYYRTPLLGRPRHDLYWSFKPGGSIGRPLGILGASMMTAMLAYTLRKRWRPLRRLGPAKMWLDYHIFFGVCGPLFIVLHSSFKVHGLVALSFWSMVAVALSGVLGRYLYRQIPRSQAGDELTLAEVEALDHALSEKLINDFSLPPSAIAELDATAAAGLATKPSLGSFVSAVGIGGLALRRKLRRFKRQYPAVEPHLRRHLERTLAEKARLRRRILLWSQLRRIFHHWHVVHKPFAVIMYLFMAVHIAVVWMTGYA